MAVPGCPLASHRLPDFNVSMCHTRLFIGLAYFTSLFYYRCLDAHQDNGEDALERRRRLLDDWVVRERRIAVIQAEQARLLAERFDMLAGEPDFDQGGDISLRSLAGEYGAAAHLPPSTAAARLTDAWMLVHRFPQTREAFGTGCISRRHVDVILHERHPNCPKTRTPPRCGQRMRSAFSRSPSGTRLRAPAHMRGASPPLSRRSRPWLRTTEVEPAGR
ncbi:hypothetical protein [Microbacterium tumbae]